MENQEVVIAEVNCEKEHDLCYGKVFVWFGYENKCSLLLIDTSWSGTEADSVDFSLVNNAELSTNKDWF